MGYLCLNLAKQGDTAMKSAPGYSDKLLKTYTGPITMLLHRV